MTQFKTFTEAEKTGLFLHGLDTEGPSQLSDAFVLGMRYGGPVAAAPTAPAEQNGRAMDFACYLIDHCERETVTEENVQRWLATMLTNAQYTAPAQAPAVPDKDDEDVAFLAARLRRLFNHFACPLPAFAAKDKSLVAIAGSVIGALLLRLEAAAPAPQAAPQDGRDREDAERANPVPGCVKPDTTSQVFFYEQDFYVLSNFSSFRVIWQGLDFDTSEHAYHWEKFPGSPEIQDAIRFARSAHDVFKIAERHKAMRRTDWDEVKTGVMKALLTQKALQHEYVRRKLLATGDRELIEDSWRDSYWGWGPERTGLNMLGQLWMRVRSELLDAARKESKT